MPVHYPEDLYRWNSLYLHPGDSRPKRVLREKYHKRIHARSEMVRDTVIARRLVLKEDYSLKRIGRVNKMCLIQSYEDQSLDIVKAVDRQKIGLSKRRNNVIVIRDVRNMVASRLEHNNRYTAIDDVTISLWKQYAYECIGSTDVLGKQKTVVIYDQWLVSKGYRRNLSQKLGLEHTDTGLDVRTFFGGGSSFDGAEALRGYGERYRSFVADPRYKEIMSDGELVALNEALIGNNLASCG